MCFGTGVLKLTLSTQTVYGFGLGLLAHLKFLSSQKCSLIKYTLKLSKLEDILGVTNKFQLLK